MSRIELNVYLDLDDEGDTRSLVQRLAEKLAAAADEFALDAGAEPWPTVSYRVGDDDLVARWRTTEADAIWWRYDLDAMTAEEVSA